jgi:pSer/pThr/pTyr-binding forkhead associated (FHA) protein
MWILEAAGDSEGGALIFRIPPGAIKTIGRASRADFILDVPLVSRLHCQLTASATGLEIFDLDSTNGTFVNDSRIKQAMLSSGDLVRIGRVSLVVSKD